MREYVRVLGKRGRVTIPLEMRQALELGYNDVIEFREEGGDILIRKVIPYTSCKAQPHDATSMFMELLEELSADEIQTIIIQLMSRWAVPTAHEKSGLI